MFYKSLLLSLPLISINIPLAYTTHFISHVLDNSCSYVKGRFDFHEEDQLISTMPIRPHDAPIQSVCIYRSTPQEMPYEKILKRAVPFQDGRQRITEVTKWPNLFHGQMSIFFAEGEYGGSGVMVGPQHMLTAAHNVYDVKKGQWASKIIVRLALNDTVAPFDEVKATRLYTFKEWINSASPYFDMALVVLEQPIGLKTGWSGLLCADSQEILNHKVIITGYPADKGFNQMWSMSHIIKHLDTEQLFYEIDTYGGQSGSSIWINKWGSPYTVGIHTLGEGLRFSGNSGVRLSPLKIKAVLEWISETRDLKQQFTFFFGQASSPSTATTMNSTITKAPVKAAPKQYTAEDYLKLGNQYLYGQGGVKANYSLAAQNYKKAAELGNTEAEYTLGRIHENGWGVKADEEEAFIKYKIAADKGHPLAQYALVQMYYFGKGVSKDEKEAARYLQMAAENKVVNAQNVLANWYEFGYGGLPQSLEKALEWNEKSANSGNLNAQYWMGNYNKNLYEKTKNPQSYTEALKWYQMAADKGDPDAQYEIGLKYFNEKDYFNAKKWFLKADEKDQPDAQEYLGRIYENGWGVQMDEKKASEFYSKAHSNGRSQRHLISLDSIRLHKPERKPRPYW